MADQVKTNADGVENEERVQALEKKTITNIYYDCLERIMNFLDIDSLVNLADTCKHLQIGAAHYFGENFGSKCIIISNDLVAPHVCDKCALVSRLKPTLAMLRCFGSKIAHLSIEKSDYSDYYKHYLMNYCGDALQNIHFHQSLSVLPTEDRQNTLKNLLAGIAHWFPFIKKQPVFPIEDGHKPFKNVKHICITNVILKDQLADVSHWFPTIQSLHLCNIWFDDDFIGVCLPRMEFLGISNVDQREFSIKCMLNLLHANQQLITLNSDIKMTLTTLLEMINGNSSIKNIEMKLNIETLTVAIESIIVNAAELERFANEHPSIVCLLLLKYQIKADDAIAFIRKLTSLDRFNFNIMGQSEYDRFTQQLDGKWKCDLLRVISGVHFIELKLIES